ncbi:MAG TPA: 6-carboxytetrahydropterin synthase [Actinospica sp.]|jgi:6-pyruvoyltetrahydropterin/6-carboxytetrahydropterin synthase|nr:6-carboxytetrahydropterin synthase [Actinospica sp.]
MAGTYRIGKQFEFQATRTSNGVPDGSGFLVEATLTAIELTEPGFVVDFGELAPLKHHLDQKLDHRNLDDVLGTGNTSDAQLAAYLEDWCRANLNKDAVDRLECVNVRRGRPTSSGPHDVTFSAQHRLGGLPEGHKCGRPHGHTYLVSPLLGQGALPDSVRTLAVLLDGTVLNEVLGFEPTSERLAHHLLRTARSAGNAELEAVRVSETASSWAEYSEQR